MDVDSAAQTMTCACTVLVHASILPLRNPAAFCYSSATTLVTTLRAFSHRQDRLLLPSSGISIAMADEGLATRNTSRTAGYLILISSSRAPPLRICSWLKFSCAFLDRHLRSLTPSASSHVSDAGHSSPAIRLSISTTTGTVHVPCHTHPNR